MVVEAPKVMQAQSQEKNAAIFFQSSTPLQIQEEIH